MGFPSLTALDRGEQQKDISSETLTTHRARPTTGSDRGSLRDHDLTLIVGHRGRAPIILDRHIPSTAEKECEVPQVCCIH